MQLHYMTLDHADALVVGFNLQGETKELMRKLWLDYMGGLYGLPVSAAESSVHRGHCRLLPYPWNDIGLI